MKKERPVIIIADDDENIQAMYAAIFERGNFETLIALNGKEVLEWLDRKKNNVDLILLDIVMPIMDGYEVLEKIGKNPEQKKIPILVSTNLDNDMDRSEAYGLGAKEVLIKTKMKPIQILEKVQNYIKK